MGAFVVTLIITPAFTLSLIRVYLAVVSGVKPDAGDAFSGFDDFWSAFKVTFLVGLYIFLWSLLFIIPGIIKSYSYSMSMYILAENKGKRATECIKESQEMTNGHKAELFVLGLSFIGWMFVCILTFGIATIWVQPYMNATFANAYKSLKPASEDGGDKISEDGKEAEYSESSEGAESEFYGVNSDADDEINIATKASDENTYNFSFGIDIGDSAEPKNDDEFPTIKPIE